MLFAFTGLSLIAGNVNADGIVKNNVLNPVISTAIETDASILVKKYWDDSISSYLQNDDTLNIEDWTIANSSSISETITANKADKKCHKTKCGK